MGKRLFDIILSFSGLMFLSPLLLIVVGLILIWDGTPVLFRQLRVGKNGLEFILNKFRTMIPLQKGSHSSFDAGDGKRVTRLGSFLRKTKFDELPQLWNVLIGDISFVGPRPEVRKWVDAYPERWAKILSVKPGITDPASIYYRNEEELLAKANDPEAYYRDVILPHKLDLYEEYVRTQSFWGDIRLIFKTILVVLFPRCFSAHDDSISGGEINSFSRKDL
jgi:lipopolysaccharide/colanic/teichoic acid biosynthesis glycosyltransferase